MQCETCDSKNANKWIVNISAQPADGDAAFKADGKETDTFILCDDCAKNMLIDCARCGFIALHDDAVIYSDCDTMRNWLCDTCFAESKL